MNMSNHCRNCGAETAAALCGKCLLMVRDYCDKTTELLPLLQDELEKTTVKASGGGSGGISEAVSIPALEIKTDLNRVIRALQVRAGTVATGNPRGLKSNAAGLQKPKGNWEEDPLAFLITEFAETLRRAVRLIDIRGERVVTGLCSNGHVLKGYSDHSGAITCKTCNEVVEPDTAQENLNDSIEEALDEKYLDVVSCYTALELRKVPIPLKTIQRWGSDGKVRKEGVRLYFPDVFDLAERRHIRRRIAYKGK